MSGSTSTTWQAWINKYLAGLDQQILGRPGSTNTWQVWIKIDYLPGRTGSIITTQYSQDILSITAFTTQTNYERLLTRLNQYVKPIIAVDRPAVLPGWLGWKEKSPTWPNWPPGQPSFPRTRAGPPLSPSHYLLWPWRQQRVPLYRCSQTRGGCRLPPRCPIGVAGWTAAAPG
jgi:hypothetical protein